MLRHTYRFSILGRLPESCKTVNFPGPRIQEKEEKYAVPHTDGQVCRHTFRVAYSLKYAKGSRAKALIKEFQILPREPEFWEYCRPAAGTWGSSSMELNWDQLRNRVCRTCVDGDNKGTCRLPVDEPCTLRNSLHEVVRAIGRAHSGSLEDRVDALRSNVCQTCEHQYANGTCWKRDALECALDRYFPIVVEIIESASVPRVETGHGPA